MNKIFWAIVVLAILIVGGIYLMGNSDTGDERSSSGDDWDIPQENLADLDSDEAVFNEIDNSVEYLE